MDEPPVRTGRAAVIPEPFDIDFADVQGLIRFGHGRLREARFFLLEIADRDAARRWMRSAPVTSALATDPPPDTALQVAFTRDGLEALGVPPDILQEFSDEFIAGMAGEESRSRRLGDVGANAPSEWAWGGSASEAPHLVAMLYARPDGLPAWRDVVKGAEWDTAFRVQACLSTSLLGETEPFGFADGLSQPRLDWQRTLPTGDKERAEYGNVLALGEVLLGYPNEYGHFTRRPLIDPISDPAALDLPPAEDAPERRDLGRNGTYLVFRQLHQDVRGFWQFLDREAGSVPEERWRLAEAMVGRTRAGAPLVPPARDAIAGVGPKPEDVAANQFTYAADPQGKRCPFGAHIRRANPRTGDLPSGTTGPIARLLSTLGFKRATFRDDLVASARFHRILRRGREYGIPITPQEALQPGPADEERGLHFICLGANISRQFEFVQNAWLESPKFDGLSAEGDPLLGSRAPLPGGRRTDVFSLPRPDGPARRITGLPQFVTVRGGAYFFLPAIRALRYIAGAPSSAPILAPVPPAPTIGTWQPVLRALHRGLEIGLRGERRLEPFFRPALNRALREPLAGFLQYLINRRRPNESLGLAEERIAPDEEASLESIIESFAGYMRRTYRPGSFERGGNTKTHGIVRAEVTIRDDVPAHMRHGIFKEPAPSRPTCATPAPDRTCRTTSRTSASSAWRSS